MEEDLLHCAKEDHVTGKRIEVTVSKGRGLGSLCERGPRHYTKERELKSLCQREEDLLHCAKEDHVTAPRREN